MLWWPNAWITQMWNDLNLPQHTVRWLCKLKCNTDNTMFVTVRSFHDEICSFYSRMNLTASPFQAQSPNFFHCKTVTKMWKKSGDCVSWTVLTLRCRSTKWLSQKKRHLAVFSISFYWQRGTRPEKRRDYYLKKSPSSGSYFASISLQTNVMTSFECSAIFEFLEKHDIWRASFLNELFEHDNSSRSEIRKIERGKALNHFNFELQI